MPLPTGGQPWPPPELRPVLNQMVVWDAWWSGDPDRLSSLYGGGPGATTRPAQYRGGVVGTVARWFWGKPPAAGEQRTKLHVPIAADICQTSSDLLFSEPPAASVEDETTQARLDELADTGVHAALLEAAELAAALGGVFLRPAWDADLSDRPWLSAVHADAAIPEFKWGRLAAVTFWEELSREGGIVLRRLERHEPGAILHGLYEGTSDQLGRSVPLTEHASTRPLATVVNADGAVTTGWPGLTAVYVPNMRPNRMWRSVPGAAHLGRSDLAGVEPLLDALDETYSSWMRDIRLGKGRIHVPSAYLQSAGGPGQGAVVDLDREAYAELNMLPRAGDSNMLTVSQFAIRVNEHRDTAADLVQQILRGAGYSAQTFGSSGDAAVTATEVVARERRSYLTRDRKIVYWGPALADAYAALLAVDKAVFGSRVVPQPPALEWQDGVSEDPQAIATTAGLLRQAEAASTDTLVRMQHPDWDDATVKSEVDAILAESGRMTADPTMTGNQMFGGGEAV
ncbi:phage portal protein [Streptomyces cinereoruber]|uniref:phage portal protein n=1 Tax=Streptomyces cinereoruber TaxID=67260 RepID=UPI003392AE40